MCLRIGGGDGGGETGAGAGAGRWKRWWWRRQGDRHDRRLGSGSAAPGAPRRARAVGSGAAGPAGRMRYRAGPGRAGRARSGSGPRGPCSPRRGPGALERPRPLPRPPPPPGPGGLLGTAHFANGPDFNFFFFNNPFFHKLGVRDNWRTRASARLPLPGHPTPCGRVCTPETAGL